MRLPVHGGPRQTGAKVNKSFTGWRPVLCSHFAGRGCFKWRLTQMVKLAEFYDPTTQKKWVSPSCSKTETLDGVNGLNYGRFRWVVLRWLQMQRVAAVEGATPVKINSTQIQVNSNTTVWFQSSLWINKTKKPTFNKIMDYTKTYHKAQEVQQVLAAH